MTVLLRSGEIQLDLRLVDDLHFATMLHHLTGSRGHNVAMRARAREHGLHLNEYGLYRHRGDEDERLDTPDEATLFAALGLADIPPELREGLGEIEAAAAGRLPQLVTPGDLRGVLTQPARLDLEWPWLRRARDAGVAIALGADAHCAADLDRIDLGLGVARKAWLTPADVINTRSAEDLLSWAHGSLA